MKQDLAQLSKVDDQNSPIVDKQGGDFELPPDTIEKGDTIEKAEDLEKPAADTQLEGEVEKPVSVAEDEASQSKVVETSEEAKLTSMAQTRQTILVNQGGDEHQ